MIHPGLGLQTRETICEEFIHNALLEFLSWGASAVRSLPLVEHAHCVEDMAEKQEVEQTLRQLYHTALWNLRILSVNG